MPMATASSIVLLANTLGHFRGSQSTRRTRPTAAATPSSSRPPTRSWPALTRRVGDTSFCFCLIFPSQDVKRNARAAAKEDGARATAGSEEDPTAEVFASSPGDENVLRKSVGRALMVFLVGPPSAGKKERDRVGYLTGPEAQTRANPLLPENRDRARSKLLAAYAQTLVAYRELARRERDRARSSKAAEAFAALLRGAPTARTTQARHDAKMARSKELEEAAAMNVFFHILFGLAAENPAFTLLLAPLSVAAATLGMTKETHRLFAALDIIGSYSFVRKQIRCASDAYVSRVLAEMAAAGDNCSWVFMFDNFIIKRWLTALYSMLGKNATIMDRTSTRLLIALPFRVEYPTQPQFVLNPATFAAGGLDCIRLTDARAPPSPNPLVVDGLLSFLKCGWRNALDGIVTREAVPLCPLLFYSAAGDTAASLVAKGAACIRRVQNGPMRTRQITWRSLVADNNLSSAAVPPEETPLLAARFSLSRDGIILESTRLGVALQADIAAHLQLLADVFGTGGNESLRDALSPGGHREVTVMVDNQPGLVIAKSVAREYADQHERALLPVSSSEHTDAARLMRIVTAVPIFHDYKAGVDGFAAMRYGEVYGFVLSTLGWRTRTASFVEVVAQTGKLTARSLDLTLSTSKATPSKAALRLPRAEDVQAEAKRAKASEAAAAAAAAAAGAPASGGGSDAENDGGAGGAEAGVGVGVGGDASSSDNDEEEDEDGDAAEPDTLEDDDESSSSDGGEEGHAQTQREGLLNSESDAEEEEEAGPPPPRQPAPPPPPPPPPAMRAWDAATAEVLQRQKERRGTAGSRAGEKVKFTRGDAAFQSVNTSFTDKDFGVWHTTFVPMLVEVLVAQGESEEAARAIMAACRPDDGRALGDDGMAADATPGSTAAGAIPVGLAPSLSVPQRCALLTAWRTFKRTKPDAYHIYLIMAHAYTLQYAYEMARTQYDTLPFYRSMADMAAYAVAAGQYTIARFLLSEIQTLEYRLRERPDIMKRHALNFCCLNDVLIECLNALLARALAPSLNTTQLWPTLKIASRTMGQGMELVDAEFSEGRSEASAAACVHATAHAVELRRDTARLFAEQLREVVLMAADGRCTTQPYDMRDHGYRLMVLGTGKGSVADYKRSCGVQYC